MLHCGLAPFEFKHSFWSSIVFKGAFPFFLPGTDSSSDLCEFGRYSYLGCAYLTLFLCFQKHPLLVFDRGSCGGFFRRFLWESVVNVDMWMLFWFAFVSFCIRLCLYLCISIDFFILQSKLKMFLGFLDSLKTVINLLSDCHVFENGVSKRFEREWEGACRVWLKFWVDCPNLVEIGFRRGGQTGGLSVLVEWNRQVHVALCGLAFYFFWFFA